QTLFLLIWVGWFIVFFFQAEDGIRYYKVTGVQTCALPISTRRSKCSSFGPGCSWSLSSCCPTAAVRAGTGEGWVPAARSDLLRTVSSCRSRRRRRPRRGRSPADLRHLQRDTQFFQAPIGSDRSVRFAPRWPSETESSSRRPGVRVTGRDGRSRQTRCWRTSVTATSRCRVPSATTVLLW